MSILLYSDIWEFVEKLFEGSINIYIKYKKEASQLLI
jgi:hypothetical protein